MVSQSRLLQVFQDLGMHFHQLPHQLPFVVVIQNLNKRKIKISKNNNSFPCHTKRVHKHKIKDKQQTLSLEYKYAYLLITHSTSLMDHDYS